MTHPALVALVRGLQLACLVTWSAAVLMRGGSLVRVILFANRSKWDRQWSSLTWFGVTQAGFALMWIAYPASLFRMEPTQLHLMVGLYVSSVMSAIGVVVAHGWTGERHRAAMAAHLCVVGLSFAASWAVG